MKYFFSYTSMEEFPTLHREYQAHEQKLYCFFSFLDTFTFLDLQQYPSLMGSCFTLRCGSGSGSYLSLWSETGSYHSIRSGSFHSLFLDLDPPWFGPSNASKWPSEDCTFSFCCGSRSGSSLHCDADPDPDPASQNDADPDPQHWWKQLVACVQAEEIADLMLKLQNETKCHNINFVTPEHVVPQVGTELSIKGTVSWEAAEWDQVPQH